MPHDPDPPPAKKFKPGSPFFLANKKPGMLLPKKGNAPSPIDVQRKQLPIYQAKSQLIDQLRQLHNAVLIGKTFPCVYMEVMLSSPSMQFNALHTLNQHLISSLLQKHQHQRQLKLSFQSNGMMFSVICIFVSLTSW